MKNTDKKPLKMAGDFEFFMDDLEGHGKPFFAY